MAKERDRHAAARRDKRRLRNQARERDEMEKLKEMNFMAQNKPNQMPPEWKLREMHQNIEASIKDEFEKRIANLETEVAMRKAGPDYVARILAAWAALLSSALVGIVVWERFFNG